MEQRVLPHRFRSGVLARYMETAAAVDLDGHAILRRARIDPRMLQDPEAWLPAAGVARVLEDSARLSGRDDFGLLLADSQSFSALGPVALLLAHEVSAREVIVAAIEFQPTISDAVRIGFVEDGATARLSLDLHTSPNSPPLVNYAVAVATTVLIDATGGKWRPTAICFRQAAPRHRETFRRFFRCPVLFEEEFDGCTCDAADLDIVNPAADRSLITFARHLLDLSPEMKAAETFGSRVADSILLLAVYGTPTLDRVAANLGLSRRSVQRRLAREGQSFEKVLNRVRRSLVGRSLAHSSKPIYQVAYSAGFSSPSAFSRWFREEFKLSPSQWRRDSRRVAQEVPAAPPPPRHRRRAASK